MDKLNEIRENKTGKVHIGQNVCCPGIWVARVEMKSFIMFYTVTKVGEYLSCSATKKIFKLIDLILMTRPRPFKQFFLIKEDS